MKIFISWSGQRERAVAEALREALLELCAADVEIFVSSRSVSKGANGVAVIEASLDSSAFGIVLVSKDNQTAPWLNYEGGWLASTLERPVATICLDLLPSDITGPLAPRQATRFEDAEDMARLLKEIVQAANPAMKDRTFTTLLAAVWPSIADSWVPVSGDVQPAPARDERSMLAELVDRVRRIEELGRVTNAGLQESLNAGYRSAMALGARERDAFWEQHSDDVTYDRSVKDAVARTAPGEAWVLKTSLKGKNKRVMVGLSPKMDNELRQQLHDAIVAIPPRTGTTSIEFIEEIGSDG